MGDEAQKHLNGNAARGRRVSEVVMQLDERIHKEENIFLFLPNIIGVWQELSTSKDPRLTKPRLLAHRSGDRISLLHALTSSNMFASVQHIMHPRRSGRLRGEKIQPVDNVRRGAGHGH